MEIEGLCLSGGHFVISFRLRFFSDIAPCEKTACIQVLFVDCFFLAVFSQGGLCE